MSKRPGDEDRARRTSAKKSYVDDDPALIAALTAAEAAHTEEDTDREAAIASGLMPYQLAEFERTCCAIPDALRRNPGRLCTLRNHFLSRASKMANRFMPLGEATKGLDPVWRTSTEESEQLKPLWQGKLAKNPITLIADALDDGFEALELREDISGHLLQADTMLYDNGFKDNGGGGGSKTEVVKEPMAELAAALKGVDKVLALLQ